MKITSRVRNIGLTILALILIFCLMACVPPTVVDEDKFPIIDKGDEANKDKTTKTEAIDRVSNGIDNLMSSLDSEDISKVGYYLAFDFIINTDDGSAFRLKLKANLFTFPYQDKEGVIDPEALKIHNEIIKKSDIIMEWYDGITNRMLIGYYFDGVNANSANRGNNLYLNLQGNKRIFPDYGDSVSFQQFIRLITQFDVNALFGGEGGTVDSLKSLLNLAVTNNYKVVQNYDTTSTFFNGVTLGPALADINSLVQGFFKPFEDKVDPLTLKYLGFKFSTLGNSEIISLNSDMQFFTIPDQDAKKDVLSGAVVDLDGISEVIDPNTEGGIKQVKFTSTISFDYSARPSTDIIIDPLNFVLYEYGSYEYIGDMYIPGLDLHLDALIRTKVNDTDNSQNEVFATFRDLANDNLIIGAYYKDERTYLDTTGLQHLYGGVKLGDIGLPKAYKEGFDLAKLLKQTFDFVDEYLVKFVDDLLAPSDNSSSDALTKAIMANIISTTKDPNIPESRNTVKMTIDIELIRKVMKEMDENKTDYTNDQLIEMINQQFNIDLRSLASILGLSVDSLIEDTFFDITLDVDTNNIRIEIYSKERDPLNPDLVLRLELEPVKIGEAVKIVFPDFTGFKPLTDVMTYSASIDGQFQFAGNAEVDLSSLLGAFMGDKSGLNTPLILPKSSNLQFKLEFDQYIREQVLANGRWTRGNRNAFSLHVFMVQNQQRTDLFKIYANDVSFNTEASIEELGYVWVDLLCVPGFPKFKIREDFFIKSMYEYMGYEVEDNEEIIVGLTDILKILLQDSWPEFGPDVIQVNTSSQVLKDLFKVDELIATLSIQVGLKQRVFNIDEMEREFAMFRVGTLENISGFGPYYIKLHNTIDVTFDYGTRSEVKKLKFAHSEASIKIVDGSATYYPAIDGTFMGVKRNYRINVTGGQIGRAQIIKLSKDTFVWEPLSSMPTTIGAVYNGTLVSNYPVIFDLDWSKISLSGGKYHVMATIGQGMMATFQQEVNITVTNREVDTNQFIYVNTQGGKVKAPVIDKIAIDPYLYIMAKAKYVNEKGTVDGFIESYFRQFLPTINFRGETPDVKEAHSWTFDYDNLNGIYLEKDINNKSTVNSLTYVHTTYLGQVIALEVIVLSRTIDHIKFENETENDTYTVDALLPETYVIPQYPIVYFKEKDANGNHIFMKFDFYMDWSNPTADNANINGTDNPFKNYDGNRTSSYVNVTRLGSFINANIFATPLIEITVLCPSKVIDDKETYRDNSSGIRSATSYNDGYVYGDALSSDIMAQEGVANGLFYADPFNTATWVIPTNLTVRFNNNNVYYEKNYNVSWEDNGLVRLINGKYTLQQPPTGAMYYSLKATIGTAETGTRDIYLAVYWQSQTYTDLEYFDANGQAMLMTKAEGEEPYTYNVDTYDRFLLPTMVKATFNDGSIRGYDIKWTDIQPWKAGANIKIKAVLGSILTKEIKLNVVVASRTINNIELLNNQDLVPTVDINSKLVNIQLEANNNLINGMTVYNYIGYLLASIRLSFTDSTTSTLVNPTLENIEWTFDTQAMLSGKGQDITVYIGQGKGADDYTFNIKLTGIRTISTGAQADMSILLFNNDNTYKYPNGYIFADQLTITINGDETYGFNGIALGNWILLDNSLGLDKYTSISSISAEKLALAGYFTITNMLPDGSRVTRKITIVGTEIGDKFDSKADEKFVINQGVITISDWYSFYPLTTSLTIDNLPKVIIIAKDIAISNIQWIFESDFDVSALTYRGLAKKKIATAQVMQQTLNLYLEIKDCTVSSVDYIDTDTTKSFVSEGLTLTFDAYKQSGYAGRFTLPEKNLNLNFSGSGKHLQNVATTYQYNNDSNVGKVVRDITYDFSGHNMADLANKNVIKVYTILADRQVVEITIKFLNKTIQNITIGASTETNVFAIDPYGEDISLPKYVKIHFTQDNGEIVTSAIDWTLPTGYKVSYAGGEFILTALIKSLGLTPQKITLTVTVHNRAFDDVDYKIKEQGSTATVGEYYHITDPFTQTVATLPKTVIASKGDGSGLVAIKDLDIVWNLADSTINTDGTLLLDQNKKYGIEIVGNVKNSAVGQQVKMRIIVDRWEYMGIRQPLPGTNDYITLNPVNFFFSKITDSATYSHYQIAFLITDPTVIINEKPTTKTINKVFYPEDSNANNIDNNYRIVWDKDAKNQAKDTGLQINGSFHLANSLYSAKVPTEGIKMRPNVVASYQYEQPHISELDLGYGRGVANAAILVVDPINPLVPTTAKGWGTLNQQSNQELGEIKLSWNDTSLSALDPKYLSGGIYNGYKITAILESANYKQQFAIKLVFLDRTPTNQPSITAGNNAPEELTATFKTIYTVDDYNNIRNVYENSYNATLVSQLNLAVAKVVNTVTITEIKYTMIPTENTKPVIIPSISFKIGQKTYQSSLIKLTVNPKSSIAF